MPSVNRSVVRGPNEIINALAARRGLVTPVPPYFPLNAAFTAECVREALRDAMDALAEAALLRANQTEAIIALQAVLDQVANAIEEP